MRCADLAFLLVRADRREPIGFDLRRALIAFQPIVLIPEPLNFVRFRANCGVECFDLVHQVTHNLTKPWLHDGRWLKAVEHKIII